MYIGISDYGLFPCLAQVQAGRFTAEDRTTILYDGDRLLASLLRIDLVHSTRGGWTVSIESQHGISLANLQHAFRTHDDGTEEVAQVGPSKCVLVAVRPVRGCLWDARC